MTKQSRRNSSTGSEKSSHDEDASLEALKARVGAAVNIFTFLFVLVAILAPTSVYIYELLYNEDPPTIWWLDPAADIDLKDLSIGVSDKESNTLTTRDTKDDMEWVKPYARIGRRWSDGTYCGSDRSLSRHAAGNSSSAKHRKSTTSNSVGFIFDATYTDYRAYVSILLKDNTQSLCETRAVVVDPSSSSTSISSTSTSPHSESLYANRTWLHVPKVYPKAFLCRFYDHKSKLLASSSSQSVIGGYYVRCPVPTAVRQRHKLLMRLQWFEDAPVTASEADKTPRMRGRNQPNISGASNSVSVGVGGSKRSEPKMAPHFSHLFPVCSFLTSEYHAGLSSTSSASDGNTVLQNRGAAMIDSNGLSKSVSNITTGLGSRLGLFSPFRNHSRGAAADSDKDLITQYNVSACTGAGLGYTGYEQTGRARLLEWLEYHRVLGVEHFFMYDLARYATNKNTNSTGAHGDQKLSLLNLREILSSYISTGVVTLVPWLEPSCQSARVTKASGTDGAEDICDSHAVGAENGSLQNNYDATFERELQRYRQTDGSGGSSSGNGRGAKKSRQEDGSHQTEPGVPLSTSDRRRQRAERLHVRAMQSCYLRYRESSHWMAFLSPDEFIGVNSHHRMRDGSKLHTLIEMLEDDAVENPHTVAVKLPTAPYFPCHKPDASTDTAAAVVSVRGQDIDIDSHNGDAIAGDGSLQPLRIDSHVYTVPAVSHSHSQSGGGRQRKYSSVKLPTRVAFARTDSVLFWSPRDDRELFAYLSNRKITTGRSGADVNGTDSKLKKKRRSGAAASESIEGLMSYSLRLTHLEPHSDSYAHVVRRIDPDIAQLMSFRSSVDVSSCQEEREIVKLADIVRTGPSTGASTGDSTTQSTDLPSSPVHNTAAAVWEQRVCRAKEVETQTRYSLPERSSLVAERVVAALAGSIPAPYLYDHSNDRL